MGQNQRHLGQPGTHAVCLALLGKHVAEFACCSSFDKREGKIFAKGRSARVPALALQFAHWALRLAYWFFVGNRGIYYKWNIGILFPYSLLRIIKLNLHAAAHSLDMFVDSAAACALETQGQARSRELEAHTSAGSTILSLGLKKVSC